MTRSAYRQAHAPDHPRAHKGFTYEHIIVAERALGKFLPKGAEVHHVDNDGWHNANTNLVICQDRAYHKLLHQRAYVKQHGGDPNTQRICGRCRQPKVFAEFSRSRQRINDGLNRKCKPCSRELNAVRNREREQARRLDERVRTLVQELYDATTQLNAVLTFTLTAEDLLSSEMDYAVRRLLAARSAVRRAYIVSHIEPALLEQPELQAPFDRAMARHQEEQVAN